MRRHIALFHALRKDIGAHNININATFKVSMGWNGKIAQLLTTVYGSMWFVYGLTVLMAGWILWQSYFDSKPFDPYPFAFLLFIGNLVQLLGGPIIQVGQNLSSAHSELRAEADYHVNQASFAKLETLEQQQLEILKQLESKL